MLFIDLLFGFFPFIFVGLAVLFILKKNSKNTGTSYKTGKTSHTIKITRKGEIDDVQELLRELRREKTSRDKSTQKTMGLSGSHKENPFGLSRGQEKKNPFDL